jgi:putative ABC transport system permease protein
MAFRLLSIRIKEGTEKSSVQWIEEVRNKFNPYYPFEYYFLSDKLDELYRSEIIINIIFRVFTLITLFVAELGLLGLSAFMTQQKTREIGVRKVHGSSSTQIVVMFLKQFSKWVILANLIAFPLAWYLLDGWLQDFYYRIDLSIIYFILAFFLTIAVALITVFWQSWRASKLQPAISLKYE